MLKIKRMIPYLILTGMLIGIYFEKIPPVFAAIYLIASTISVILYAKDKYSATKGQRRVPESTLHIVALVGGWPGAMLAQEWLRHKTIKRSFRNYFWLSAGVNVGVVTSFLVYIQN